ncbi:MAG: ParA family protein, partial [Actinomycetes bacterium]
VLVDCAPALGPTTRAGLASADRVLLVVELSALSLRGAEAVLEEVEHVWAELNPALDVGGVVVNRSLSTSSEGERQAQELDRLMGSQAVWRPYIPQRTVINEAMGHRVPIHDMGYRAKDVVEVFESLYDQLVTTLSR